MSAWWNALTGLEQIFAGVAIPATIILLLQTVMLLFGLGDSHSDFDASGSDAAAGHFDSGEMHQGDIHTGDTHDGEIHDVGLRVFTVRGFVAFFSIFGWAGVVFLKSGMSVLPSILLAFVLGSVSMIVLAVTLAFFLKLQSNGTADISSAVGVTGSVYLTIPAKRSGTGKVTLMVSGQLSEYDAVTDEKMPIKSGTSVTVTAITGFNTLVVIVK